MPPLNTLGQWRSHPIEISDGDDDDSEDAPRARQPSANSRKRSLILAMEDEEEEDEITVALPVRSAKRARLTGEGPSKPRLSAVRMVNGTMTPVTDAGAASPWSRTSVSDTDSLRRQAVRQQPRPGLDSVITIDSDDEPTITPVLRSERSWHEVSDAEAVALQAKALRVSAVRPAYPRWMYQGWQAPVQSCDEHSAMSALLRAFGQVYATPDLEPEWTYFMLDEFSIYQSSLSVHHVHELVTLEKLTQDRNALFCFAGVISFGDTKFYVQDVPFKILTLEYGELRPWHDRICIQSKLAKKQDVYYKLGRPATEYQRFYTPFLGIAAFTDYFIDYLCQHETVTIADFRQEFWNWLKLNYADDGSFQTWHKEVKLRDFRTLVAVNVVFLWKECSSIDEQSACSADPTRLCRQPLWAEVLPWNLCAIPAQPVNYNALTVVTPYAHRCFQSMYFGQMLGVHRVTDSTLRDTIAGRKNSLGLTPLHSLESRHRAPKVSITPLRNVADVHKGDVIVLDADRSGDWKLSKADHWYAYVQRIWGTGDAGGTRLDVIWLYQPSDTTIGDAFYPYSNEFFLSDNCSCGQDALYLDSVDDILGTVDVTWRADNPSAGTGLFVRRTFRTVPELNQYDFIQLDDQHFCCHHQDDFDEVPTVYHVGDVVLVRRMQDVLGRSCRPAMVILAEGDHIRLQRMSFASETIPDARPNELVFTSDEIVRHRDAIVRQCHVRIFGQDQTCIPTPYDRDGAGHYYYIVEDRTADIDDLLNMVAQDWDPLAKVCKPILTGLGLFCGGGSFDRGLEEGGAVRFRYAVDINKKALHSYRANDPHPEQTKYYLGSVNEYLASALDNLENELIAKPGDVDVISAGSPCQGFSMMNNNQLNEQSLRNASMVASVTSFVDAYAPQRLLLENVVSMTRTLPNGDNVFSQMIASLVGLGYQVQQYLMDSDTYGSPQARPRVFIVATAPTCSISPQPDYTHARPTHLKRQRHLGKCSNGKPFGSRSENAFVPFGPYTAKDSVCDLPDMQDGQTQLCVPYPDHRPATEETPTIRNRIASVPKRPYGMTLVRAVQASLVRGEPFQYCNGSNRIKNGPASKAYGRVFPDQQFATMITKLSVGDGLNGQVVHWEQDRVLTIMEARRAQGYPDHEVLVGLPTDRMKIVGNSVDRKVALVLGLALRDSWLKSPPLDNDGLRFDSESDTGSSSAGSVTAPDLTEFDAFRSGISADTIAMPNLPNQDTEPKAPANDTAEGSILSVNSSPIDNKTVKMALNWSQEEMAEIRVGGFKRINALVARPEHRAARQSLHGVNDGQQEVHRG
ncbi:putative BAH domain, C-5 cytosine methyltransferase, DNA methylase, C-5 cytosine-specific, active [Septoria linicola]|nr:putative BAH domain, C-5 cytosine methyltransferase, DNA methylase, C-5 cytosine-specific, active [Septoria linicola]